MEKQDVIKKAYEKLGFDWGQCKQFVFMETGALILPTPDLKYTLKGYDNLIKEENKDQCAFSQAGLHVYLKDLKGIMTNNHWRKIESEDDLPKETDSYWVYRKDGSMVCHHFSTESEFDRILFLEHFTHYQPIKKPSKPLY